MIERSYQPVLSRDFGNEDGAPRRVTRIRRGLEDTRSQLEFRAVVEGLHGRCRGAQAWVWKFKNIEESHNKLFTPPIRSGQLPGYTLALGFEQQQTALYYTGSAMHAHRVPTASPTTRNAGMTDEKNTDNRIPAAGHPHGHCRLCR